MSEAPERIWTTGTDKTGSWNYRRTSIRGPIETKYVRADRIEELEAKLAKAVLSVKRLSTSECFGSSEVWGLSLSDSPLGREILARMDYANTTLAELTGGKDE